MNRKIFYTFMFVLFVFNVVSVLNITANEDRKKIDNPGDIVIVGVMDRVNATDEYKDYKIHVAVIIEESIDIYINKEGTLRVYNPHGLEYYSVVILFCNDWEII